jgi:Na+-translocating ferredoxin:NAD+ oxidoreductase RnfG subunit
VALVIVISLVALLTVVSVALLLLVGQSTQRTAGEVAAQQSEALAQTAFEIMLGDLSDELAKGSSGMSVNALGDGSSYLQYDLSGKRQGMRVSKSLGNGAPGAGVLVKQSQAE